ncbi:MAG TPA: 16S rRNA (guanine(966)-N(2))-methyltransferase RsmD [Candidatus Aminicenantes bacterium]|nr:16S rRNA (guanine(966)-N(2))-methyltransferase RsmD [Candidatus Aminicenantes bacterium]HDT13034.1 16S rRNA (guanine(966)-N(2))-methyltransferase RsmD [Candidatus Aminicenantes bacterium]
MIRIIGGVHKNRRLKLVPGAAVRPMQDKVKGALFNILGERVCGAVVLDGFAGTGSIGLEALSRGAATCVFVDEHAPAVKVIKANVEKCGAGERSVVLHREFNRAVIDLAGQGVRFDLIVLDPPYRLLEERNPLKVIRKRGLLGPGGLIVLRRHFKTRPKTGDFELERQVTLGDDVLAFYAARVAGTGDDASAEGRTARAKGPRKRLPAARGSPKMGP